MEVIIIGCGKVGVTLADQLVREDHNVVMVDTSAERLQSFSERRQHQHPIGSRGSDCRHSDSSDRFR